jgi:hypothetical protein
MVANPDRGVAVLYAAGHVVAGGRASFAGYLTVADSTGYVRAATPAWRMP